jgi:predicted RND superfamily exporter protein
MSKTKLTLPVPLLKTLDELEETTNDNAHSNRLLEASRGVHADLKSKSKEMPQHSSARSSSSITTISNTTNIKTKLKQNPQLPFKKTSSNGRKKSISETSLDESAVSSEQSKPESYRPPSKPGLDYEKVKICK